MEEKTVRARLRQLSVRQKAFLIAYVQIASFDKMDAWCLARYNKTYIEVCAHLERKYSRDIVATKISAIRSNCFEAWSEIERVFGGIHNLMDFIGLDDARLILEHKRLMNAQKPMVNSKTGEIIWYDDASAQVKNLQLLHEVRGNLSERKRHEGITGGSMPLRIDFGDQFNIPMDNMLVYGDVEMVNVTPQDGE